ncbi:helix-turn-helix transcriptional regulator [Roseomonas sp. ACRSG]|nr:helix-turn-helix transcriptional regulator [Roseomonas sp. ACRSG]
MPDNLADLIADLYDMATGGCPDGLGWQAVLDRMARLSGSQSGILHISTPAEQSEILGAHGCDSAMAEAYEAHFHRHDIFRTPFRSFQAGKLLLSQTYVADEDVARSEFHNDFLSRLVGNAFYNAGAYWELPGKQLLFLGMQRTRGAGPLSRQGADLLQQVLPHLPRAIRLAERAGATREARGFGLDALDLLPSGVLVLEADRRVAFANRVAERLIQRAGMVSRPGGQIRLRLPEEDNRLAQLVRQATRRESGIPPLPGTMLCARDAGPGLQLALLVVPFQPRQHQRTEGSRPLALVLITDPPGQPGDLVGQIVQLFGLSPSEAEVAVALASGLSPEDIARERAVQVNTIRGQIKSAMFKTGTRRQGELIRLLLSLPRLAPGA